MEQSEKSDEEIVALSLQDQAHFGELISRYEVKLDRYITRLGVRTVEDRQDVLQEVFIKVYKNLNGFDTTMKFSSWIYRIAHNEAISWYRRQRVRPEGHLVQDSETIFLMWEGESDSAEHLFDESVNAKEVTRAISELDQKYRAAIILRFFEHKEYEEISDILKIPTGSVGTLIHRGKQQLKKLVDTQKIRV